MRDAQWRECKSEGEVMKRIPGRINYKHCSRSEETVGCRRLLSRIDESKGKSAGQCCWKENARVHQGTPAPHRLHEKLSSLKFYRCRARDVARPRPVSRQCANTGSLLYILQTAAWINHPALTGDTLSLRPINPSPE